MNNLSINPALNFTGKVSPNYNISRACKNLAERFNRTPEAASARIDRYTTLSAENITIDNSVNKLSLNFKKNGSESTLSVLTGSPDIIKKALGENRRDTVLKIKKMLEELKAFYAKGFRKA